MIDPGRRSDPTRPGGSGMGARVGPEDVRDLIRRADASDHGRRFLLRGSQDAVAATFGVHAFVVDAARDQLMQGGPGT